MSKKSSTQVVAAAVATSAFVAPLSSVATPLNNAMDLAFPNVRERAAFQQMLAAHVRNTGGQQFLVIDTGTTTDRILVLSGCTVAKVAEPFLREFTFTDEAGKKHIRVIRVSIHRNVSTGVYCVATLTKESSNQARYDGMMGRKTVSKPVASPAPAAPVTPAPVAATALVLAGK